MLEKIRHDSIGAVQYRSYGHYFRHLKCCNVEGTLLLFFTDATDQMKYIYRSFRESISIKYKKELFKTCEMLYQQEGVRCMWEHCFFGMWQKGCYRMTATWFLVSLPIVDSYLSLQFLESIIARTKYCIWE